VKARAANAAMGRPFGRAAAAAVLCLLTVPAVGTEARASIVPTYARETDFNFKGFIRPWAITLGPDGNEWFTDFLASKIGRITPSGKVTEYPVPGPTDAGPTSITSGPDGNIWFGRDDAVGRVTPRGRVSLFSLPPRRGTSDITAGPDGNVWYSDGYGYVGRVTHDGQITEFGTGSGTDPASIASGSDGNLWVVSYTTPHLIRVSPSGEMKKYNMNIESIIAGPDGNMWGEAAGARIVRFPPSDPKQAVYFAPLGVPPT
jgi:virginiamycin B lyase